MIYIFTPHNLSKPISSDLFIRFTYFSIMYNGYFVYKHACAPHACITHRGHKRTTEFWNCGYRYSYELPYGCQELNSCPLQEHSVLLNTEKVSQPSHLLTVPFPLIFFIVYFLELLKQSVVFHFTYVETIHSLFLAMGLMHCMMEVLTKGAIYFLRQIHHDQMSVSIHRAPCMSSTVMTSKVQLRSMCKPRQFSQQAQAVEPRHSLVLFISQPCIQLCHSSPYVTLHLREYQIKSMCIFKYLRCCLLRNSPCGLQMLRFYEDQSGIVTASTILSLESTK